MSDESELADALDHELAAKLGPDAARAQEASDGVPTLWLSPEAVPFALKALAEDGAPFLLLDEFGLDDALGGHADGGAVTLVYSLLRLEPFARLRLKTRLDQAPLEVQSATASFPNADWYERELRAHAGVHFRAHPDSSPLPAEARASLARGDDELDIDVGLPRALAMEALLNVRVPPRAQAIRVLRCELLRVASHLFWYGAFVEAVGAIAPAFYAAADARRVLEVSYELGGAHPERFLIGGVKQDLPQGWRATVETFLEEMRLRARDYAEMALSAPTLQVATKGVSPMEASTAVSWGVTGPVLRAAGLRFDIRKAHPYCGYERYDFSVPSGAHGDLYDRVRVRLEEMRESLRVLDQCVRTLPDGPIMAPVPRTLVPGEAMAVVESSRGAAGCYVASDGAALFVRHRTPSFPHLQAVSAVTSGADADDRSAVVSSVDIGIAPSP